MKKLEGYFPRPVKRSDFIKNDKYYEELQRKRIAHLAREGAKIANLGKMCNTCAFKLDSDANLEPHNVDAAENCLAWGGQFNCHLTSGIDKGCECVGFKYAKAFLEQKIEK